MGFFSPLFIQFSAHSHTDHEFSFMLYLLAFFNAIVEKKKPQYLITSLVILINCSMLEGMRITLISHSLKIRH